jgi:predicted kinase
MTTLVMLSGLPGVGKSALADELGPRLPAVVVSVDPIEAAMLRSGLIKSFETGLAAYAVGAAVAEHQLSLGLSVIADAANDLEVGRDMWRTAAERGRADVRIIELVCSDEAEHRLRLQARKRDLDPYPEPTWEDVVRRRRETEAIPGDHLVLDTADPIDDNIERALAHLAS